jgi:hypothetical protein
MTPQPNRVTSNRFFPHRYCPLASDMVDLDKLDIKFDQGEVRLLVILRCSLFHVRWLGLRVRFPLL